MLYEIWGTLYQRLEELYFRKNDFQNAYNYHLKADAYNDSVRNLKIHNSIAEMEMRYKQDTTLLRKDLRITGIEKRASQWKNFALLCLLLLMTLTVVTVIVVQTISSITNTHVLH